MRSFEEIERLCFNARDHFHQNKLPKLEEIRFVFDVTFEFLNSISKFKSPNEWENSREESFISVLMQALETILAMYVLSESGFWDNALVLKRNYAELLCIAIALGYDKQLRMAVQCTRR